MVAFGEIVLGRNIFMSVCPFNRDNCSLVSSALGIATDCVLLFLSCLVLHVISRSFTSNALESMSLRIGRKSELVAVLLRSLFLSSPEIALSTVAFRGHGHTVNVDVMTRTILQGGWICLLLIPGLVAIKAATSLPTSLVLRELIVLSIVMAIWSLLLPSVGITPSSCFVLFLIYVVYIISVSMTAWIEQEQRDLRRESRLIFQLAPIADALEPSDCIETVPIQLVGPPEEAPTVVTLGISKRRLYVPSSLAPSRPSLIERALALICVRAVPGTDSEKLYLVSLINSFIIEILLGVSAIILSENLLGRITSARMTKLVSPTILAILSKTPHLIPAVTRTADQHIILDAWGSHIAGLTLGSSIPWLVGLMLESPRVVTISVPTMDICCSACAVCVVSLIIAFSLSRNRHASLTVMSQADGKLLLTAAACTTIAAILGS